MTNPAPSSEIPASIPAPAGDALVRQSHGGALKRGGTNPRAGRPPNAIKASCRKDFDEVRPLLRELAKTGRMKLKKARGSGAEGGEEEEVVASFADRIRAIDLLGKYGMDQNVSIADVRACLKATQQEIRELLPKDQYEMLWARIMPHWLKL